MDKYTVSDKLKEARRLLAVYVPNKRKSTQEKTGPSVINKCMKKKEKRKKEREKEERTGAIISRVFRGEAFDI